MGRLKPLSAVFMPAPAVNGADPETADGARETAPNRMQGLGRLVAVPDYEAEAMALPGVRKARAAWVAPQGSPRLQLIVLTDGGTEAEAAAVAAAMTSANRCRGANRFPIETVQGIRQYLHVDLTVGYEPERLPEDLEPQIRLALGVQEGAEEPADGLFGFEERQFGQGAHVSQVIGVVQQVRGRDLGPGGRLQGDRPGRSARDRRDPAAGTDGGLAPDRHRLCGHGPAGAARAAPVAQSGQGRDRRGVPGMTTPRQSLYRRLPEIYRIRDAELFPVGQLQAYLDVLDEIPAGMRDNIEALYHDLFIETCADWVVPYIADLLGTSHLSGDPWTLRADVARTVFHRRRKGTLGAVESLVFTLSGWAAQAVELRNNLAWTQHLNHQRPDAGGVPPLLQRTSLASAVRGGTLPIRAPAVLSFLNGPFDPFAHVADFKPGEVGVPRYNLPNLGIFLWRLEDYTVPVADPGVAQAQAVAGAAAGEAAAVVRCIVHPQGDPMVLFNTHRYRMDDEPPNLSHPDEVPAPMPWPRLTSQAEYGNPAAYVRVDQYLGAVPAMPGAGSPGLVLHVPDPIAPPTPVELAPPDRWLFRGANLCAWEAGLSPPLREYEIAIDPDRGRVLFGLADLAAEAQPLADGLFVTHTYGFSGPTGAHPVARDSDHRNAQRSTAAAA